MNKRGLGAFRITGTRSLKVALWLAAYVCSSTLFHDTRLYGQQGVRGRERSAAGVTIGARTPKPYRLTVSTKPPASCLLSITSARIRKEPNRPMQYKLEENSIANLYKGSYVVVAQCKGYETYSTIVNVPQDIPALSLPLMPLPVQIVLVTNPPEAEVSLGNQSLGRSGKDGSLRLPALRIGRYQLSVRKDGYIERLTEIDVQRDNQTVPIDLRRDESLLLSQALGAAISEGRLLAAFTLYEELAGKGFDPVRLRDWRSRLFEELDQRSLRLLRNLSPGGLNASQGEVEEMRKLYRRAEGLSDKEGPGSARVSSMFLAFWEIHGLVAALSAQPENSAQSLVALHSQLEWLEALRPENAFVWYDLASIYLRLREFNRAEQGFEKARTLKPDWAYPYFGSSLLQMNQAYSVKNDKKAYRSGLLRAAAGFEAAVAKDPGFLRAYIMATFCYADAAEGPKGVSLARQALARAPGSGPVNFALGYAYFASGRKQYANARLFLTAAMAATEDRLDATQVTIANDLLNRIAARHQP